MDIQQIMERLPHRYPMLLVDRLLHHDAQTASGIKQLSHNEWYFEGHFPGAPQMPAGLLLEAMGQVGAAAVLALPGNAGLYLFLAGMDNVTFHATPVPGDCLRMEARLLRNRGNSGRTRVECRRDDELVATAEYTYVLGSEAGTGGED